MAGLCFLFNISLLENILETINPDVLTAFTVRTFINPTEPGEPRTRAEIKRKLLNHKYFASVGRENIPEKFRLLSKPSHAENQNLTLEKQG